MRLRMAMIVPRIMRLDYKGIASSESTIFMMLMEG